MLHELGEPEPDTNAFARDENLFRCCHFVEYPIGEYNFSLMRHFLFDHAMFIRYGMLSGSSYEPLASAVRKFKGEMIYHVLHADTWIKQLSQADEESYRLMQSALDECLPLALGMFETLSGENLLSDSGIYSGEELLRQSWIEKVVPLIESAGLILPDLNNIQPAFGGRKGIHTDYLKPLLDEMSEVFKIDPDAEW